jgi:hypothetical protein
VYRLRNSAEWRMLRLVPGAEEARFTCQTPKDQAGAFPSGLRTWYCINSPPDGGQRMIALSILLSCQQALAV